MPNGRTIERYADDVRAQPRLGQLEAVECLALDVFSRVDIGGQLITRQLVQKRWDQLAAHRAGCGCGVCVMLPSATVTKVWRLAARWQADVNKTRILAQR